MQNLFLIFTGDFNVHSVQWWPDVDSNNEGIQLNILFSELGLSQLISEPTHFREHCRPSCIDSSLDQTCKDQLTYCKLSIINPRIAPSKRLVWQYDKAKCDLINKALTDFQWELHLNNKPDNNSQVKFLNQTILNIMTNFVPSSILSSTLYLLQSFRQLCTFFNPFVNFVPSSILS